MTNKYNRIAPFYDALSRLVYGNRLWKIQTSLLHHLPSHGRLLILGGGTGRILEVIYSHSPSLQIDYLEASDKMIELARKRIQIGQEVDFIHADQLPNNEYDAVIASFFFDQFPAEELTIWRNELIQRVNKGGKIIISDFHLARGWWQKCLLWWTILFFRWSVGYRPKQLPPIFDIWETSEARVLETNMLSDKLMRSTVLTID